jgi:hypothetical protein
MADSVIEIIPCYINGESTYYQENRIRILAKSREKTRCECGVDVSYSNRKCHSKSLRHQIFLRSKESNERLQHQRQNT